MASQPSCVLPTVAMWGPWRCCWTAAPTWRPRTRSAHRPRHRHVAPLASSEVAMRPAAALSAAGPLLGRRGRGVACRVRVWGVRGLRLLVRPWSRMGRAGVGGMRVWTLQNGDTALMVAARNGKVEAVALLLDRGADLEAKDNVSPSAAPLACRPAGVVRGRDAGSCSAERGRSSARAAGPGACTGERRVGCGCGA